MTNGYFDSFTRLERDTLARAEQVNAIGDAIKVAFDKMPAQDRLVEGRVTWGTASGSPNAMLVTLPYTVAYDDGLHVGVQMPFTNTTGITINVNSLGVKNAYRYDGTALQANDCISGEFREFRYSATLGAFVMLGPYPPSGGSVTIEGTQRVFLIGSIGGTADAITGTASPTMSAYDANIVIQFTPVSNNTGAVTINISGLGAISLKSDDGSALVADELQAGVTQIFVNNGTYFIKVSTPKATQAQAVAGTLNSAWMSPLRVLQSITVQIAAFLVTLLSQVNVWTKAQRGAVVTLTDASPIAWDMSLGNNFKVTLTASRALGAPTNVVAGQSGALEVFQDGTGGWTLDITNAAYQTANGTDFVVSSSANAKTIVPYYVDSTSKVVLGFQPAVS